MTLVKRLAVFAEHRLNKSIPILAMAVLKRIAQEMNMSLLACLGGLDVVFRDLIIQRLEFKCEDVTLKVSWQKTKMTDYITFGSFCCLLMVPCHL
jgi:hypothetical protein